MYLEKFIDVDKKLTIEDIPELLKDLIPYSRGKEIKKELDEVVMAYPSEEGDSIHRFVLYTEEYKYSFKVVLAEPFKGDYIGASYTCRKPYPGEDYTRGGDLPDGKLTVGTWLRILQRIIENEVLFLGPMPECGKFTNNFCVRNP